MLLEHDSAFRFIDGYKAILLHVLTDAGLPRTASITNDLASARTHAKDAPELIEAAIAALESNGQTVEPAVVAAVRSMKVDHWVYLRHAKSFAVFIDKAVENAYQVRALTTPLNELVDEPALLFETGVFKYEGRFVCDGLVLNPVRLGTGYKAQFEAAYSALRKAGRVHSRATA